MCPLYTEVTIPKRSESSGAKPSDSNIPSGPSLGILLLLIGLETHVICTMCTMFQIVESLYVMFCGLYVVGLHGIGCQECPLEIFSWPLRP